MFREKQDPEDFLVCQVYLVLMALQVSRVTVGTPATQDHQEWVWRVPSGPQECQDLQVPLASENRAYRDAEARQENQENVVCRVALVLLVLQVTASSAMLWPRKPTAREQRRDLKLFASFQICLH